MFDPSASPRLFGLPPGADFPAELVRGLCERMAGQPPEAMARVELYVNTARMQRRLREIFASGPARLLPRIRMLTALADDARLTGLPPAVPRLRRRLELTRLVTALIEREPSVAPRAAAFDLATSLARLTDEMQSEGVPPGALADLDVSNASGHWKRALDFIAIVQPYFEAGAAADPEARQRRAVEAQIAAWRIRPPEHPVLVAGSTGSRGTTALLIDAVARLPQGAVVLPGVDFDLPEAVWAELADPLTGEDHPQFRFARLAGRLGIAAGDIGRWTDADPEPRRNRLVSMALRPAPVTDQWLSDGPGLGDLRRAAKGLSLIEAPDDRIEALAIALCLRGAVEDGRRAALITPDRMLTRQVTAELKRWNIEPDDSAGRPLSLSAPGRLLRQVAGLIGRPLTPEALLALLKHPLVQTGGETRGPHLRHAHMLELWLRDASRPALEIGDLRDWAAAKDDAGLQDWAAWLGDTLLPLATLGGGDPAGLLGAHVAVCEALASGPGGAPAGGLWEKKAGQEARAVIDELARDIGAAEPMRLSDYQALIEALLSEREVRDPLLPHPDVLIWGTLEARVQGADLVILGGLADGIWPEAQAADPWLNRALRHQAGLLLPERRIGLSAHDFQQAIAAPLVVLSRALRNAETETVPSRWLSRLQTLLAGLPDTHGPEALAEMRARGAVWISAARALDARAVAAPRARRPAPAPPAEMRPAGLRITDIQKLIRDPYAIYARYVLGLARLGPLRPEPDMAMKGTVIHAILETFARSGPDPAAPDAVAGLLDIAAARLKADVPWATARALWYARMARMAAWIVANEAELRREAQPWATERSGRYAVPGTAVTLRGKADRIDRADDGSLRILDYKTGSVPTEAQMLRYDPQLLVEAIMAEAGAFEGLDSAQVREVGYIRLNAHPACTLHGLREGTDGGGPAESFDPAVCLEKLRLLLVAYASPAKGYMARRAMEKMRYANDYDDLARFTEWDTNDTPQVVVLP